jgi:hypothetical protein
MQKLKTFAPGGSWISTSNLIDKAVNVWKNGYAVQQIAISRILDILNNSAAIEYVYYEPCPVVYP